MALNKLLNNGVKCGLFEISSIGNISKSPSKDVQTEVIDYDKVKEKISGDMNEKSQYGFDQPKSCDALKIIPEKVRVDFIEFKGFEQFKARNSIEKETDPRIRATIDNFDLDTKIESSCHLFFWVLQISKLGLSKDERKFINDIDKNYLVMVDIAVKRNPEQVFAASLDFLSHPTIDKAIIKHLEDKLDKITYVTHINKPILIGADDIDRYYQDVLSGT